MLSKLNIKWIESTPLIWELSFHAKDGDNECEQRIRNISSNATFLLCIVCPDTHMQERDRFSFQLQSHMMLIGIVCMLGRILLSEIKCIHLQCGEKGG